MTQATPAMPTPQANGGNVHKPDGADMTGHLSEKIADSAHEIAENARMSVVKAIEAAAEKLNAIDFGHSRASQTGYTYARKLSVQLDKLSELIADTDSSVMASNVKAAAVKYRTPLIVGTLALAAMMWRSGHSNKN